jgi:hypothetical protein
VERSDTATVEEPQHRRQPLAPSPPISYACGGFKGGWLNPRSEIDMGRCEARSGHDVDPLDVGWIHGSHMSRWLFPYLEGSF